MDRAVDFEPVAAADDEVILAVVGHLGQVGTGKVRSNRSLDKVPGQLFALIVGDRNVAALALSPGDSQADEVGGHRVGAGGLDVEREDLRPFEGLDHIVKPGLVLNTKVRMRIASLAGRVGEQHGRGICLSGIGKEP